MKIKYGYADINEKTFGEPVWAKVEILGERVVHDEDDNQIDIYLIKKPDGKIVERRGVFVI